MQTVPKVLFQDLEPHTQQSSSERLALPEKLVRFSPLEQ